MQVYLYGTLSAEYPLEDFGYDIANLAIPAILVLIQEEVVIFRRQKIEYTSAMREI